MTLVASAVASMFSKHVALIFQVQQGPIVMIATKDNASAATAVTTIRTSIRIVFHMPKVHRTLTALS